MSTLITTPEPCDGKRGQATTLRRWGQGIGASLSRWNKHGFYGCLQFYGPYFRE